MHLGISLLRSLEPGRGRALGRRPHGVADLQLSHLVAGRIEHDLHGSAPTLERELDPPHAELVAHVVDATIVATSTGLRAETHRPMWILDHAREANDLAGLVVVNLSDVNHRRSPTPPRRSRRQPCGGPRARWPTGAPLRAAA